MTTEKEYVKKLVSKGNAVITEKTKRTPDKFVPDGAILGNGDLGAVIKNENNGFSYLMGKNDFWRIPCIGETKEERYERLINHQNMRRTGVRIMPVGWINVEIDGMDNNIFKTVQSIYEAVTETEFEFPDGNIYVKSWICATQNTLVVEFENKRASKTKLTFSLNPGMYKGMEYSYEDGCTKNYVWLTYGANNGNTDKGRRVAMVAGTNVETEYFPEKFTGKGGLLEIEENQSAKLYLTVISDCDSEKYFNEAIKLNLQMPEKLENLRKAHLEYWEKYWAKSTVETGNDLLDKFYYFSLYGLASAAKKGKVAPAMYGPWTTDDFALWSGAYTMNYNYQSPFLCLYSSNRQEIAESYIDTTNQMIETGEWYAKANCNHRGVLLPVEMGPWGNVCSTVFFNQKTNAAYSCVNLFMHYFSTMDREIGLRVYPFIKKNVEFWEDDLVFENGFYNIVGDSAHEEYVGCGEKNNVHGLGLVKMLFSGIIKMSGELDIDENLRSKWQNIYDNLPHFPTFERNGEKVIRYNEEDYAWRDMNGTPVKFMYPFMCVSLDSDEEFLKICRNTLNQKSYLFDQTNALCEYSAMRAVVDCDSETTYNELVNICKKFARPNNWLFHSGEGIECFNAVPGAINQMFLQSHGDAIRVFPSWPENKDAKFDKLRAYGAFLVSSEIKDNTVLYIKIKSEKGRVLNVRLPWEKAFIIQNGEKSEIFGNVAKISTKAEDTIELYPFNQ